MEEERGGIPRCGCVTDREIFESVKFSRCSWGLRGCFG